MANRDIWDEIELVGTGEHLDEEMFEFLSAYADGECSAKERRLVEAYLAENAAAREQLAGLRMQSAFNTEGQSDPPEWLRGAIMSKTVDRPRLKWPFAAGIAAATAGAAALAVYWAQPAITPPTENLVATNVIDEPVFESPVTETNIQDVPIEAPVTNEPTETAPEVQPIRRSASNFVPASRSITTEEQPAVKQVPPKAPEVKQPAPKQPDPAITYAVVEYGATKLDAEKPDVFDSEPLAAESNRGATVTSPPVLPDAREKLRDKVRKMNQEKLEIEGASK